MATRLFRHPDPQRFASGLRCFARGGQRFMVVEAVGEKGDATPHIHVVQNWYEEFRDREQD